MSLLWKQNYFFALCPISLFYTFFPDYTKKLRRKNGSIKAMRKKWVSRKIRKSTLMPPWGKRTTWLKSSVKTDTSRIVDLLQGSVVIPSTSLSLQISRRNHLIQKTRRSTIPEEWSSTEYFSQGLLCTAFGGADSRKVLTCIFTSAAFMGNVCFKSL